MSPSIESQIDKKGILALKEEYEKEVRRLRDYYQENFYKEDVTPILYKVKTLEKVIDDLEELLK